MEYKTVTKGIDMEMAIGEKMSLADGDIQKIIGAILSNRGGCGDGPWVLVEALHLMEIQKGLSLIRVRDVLLDRWGRGNPEGPPPSHQLTINY